MALLMKRKKEKGKRKKKTLRLCVLSLFFLFPFAFFLRADEGAPLEYQVKAAFLLNFTKFVEWPDSAFAGPDAPITICILGEDPFGKALDQIVEGESIGNRKVVVNRIKHAPSPKSCQALFVADSQRDTAKTLAEAGPGVLTVGESVRFLSDGGIISFVIERGRVRFDINVDAANKANLKVSSKLLKVARFVKDAPAKR